MQYPFKLIALIYLLFLIPFTQAMDAAYVGQLANVQGIVKVDGISVKEGAYLKKGSVITTEEGKVSVMLGNETIMHLDSHAILKIDDYVGGKKGESGNLNLQQGTTRTLVRNLGGANFIRKNLFIRTKAAVMGVRGTEVLVSSPPNAAPTFSVVRGEALIQMAPPIGAPPAMKPGGPGREFILKGGQSVTTPATDAGNAGKSPNVAVENKDGAQLTAQAQEVAPPPAKVETKKQMDAFIASSNPFGINPNLTMMFQPGLFLDPIANGGKIPVSISISGTGITKY